MQPAGQLPWSGLPTDWQGARLSPPLCVCVCVCVCAFLGGAFLFFKNLAPYALQGFAAG